MGRVSARWIGAVAALTLAACSTRVSPDAQTGAPPSAAEAARFLTQSTFGATDATIAQVRASGYAGWIDQQLIAPQTGSHLADLNERQAFLLAQPNPSAVQPSDFYWTFWEHAAG